MQMMQMKKPLYMQVDSRASATSVASMAIKEQTVGLENRQKITRTKIQKEINSKVNAFIARRKVTEQMFALRKSETKRRMRTKKVQVLHKTKTKMAKYDLQS
jgi:zona occludens toxin (predicted ATPase)